MKHIKGFNEQIINESFKTKAIFSHLFINI